MTADLSALIARLEAAEVGSVRPVTTSLDAALALAERLNVKRLWNLWKSNSGYVASFEGDNYSRSATPALALCIAILKAKLDGYGAEGGVNQIKAKAQREGQ